MRRLIDANALMKAIRSFRWLGPPNTLKLMFEYLRLIIRDQPTVDAVEVVHGRWNVDRCEVGDPFDGNSTFITDVGECSVCGHRYETLPDMNYCPNCGAKMDGERRTDNDNQN